MLNLEKDYNALLYEKMEREQEKYKAYLLEQSPSEILYHTYQYAMREDILMTMEDLELSPQQAKVLLKSPCPLEDVYKEFAAQETDHMDNIRNAIETRANTVIDRNKENCR